MKQLIIGGEIFNYPENGTEPSWGEEATAWAEAVTDALEGLSSTGDILTRTFTPSNNQSSLSNVVGLSFDSSTIQGFIAEVSIFRSSDTRNASEMLTLHGAYNSIAATWEMSQIGSGQDAEITFTLTSLGQLQYTSTDWGTGHTCRIVFRARAFTNA